MGQKYFGIGLLLFGLATSYWLLATGLAVAQTRAPTPTSTQASVETTVKASVGKYYFSAYGFASPFASIVMRSQSYFLGSTVADQNGVFSIKRVFVNQGFSEFCFETIDVKRLGDSYTCLKIEPLKADGEKRDIFLPPTLGLSARTIRVGSSVSAFGYSMPGVQVKVDMGKGLYLQANANQNGKYTSEIKDLPVGQYTLLASAKYQSKTSEKPLRGKDLKSLSFTELIMQNLPKALLILLLVLLVIILLIILISKRIIQKIRELHKKEDRKSLHHDWFIGF